MLLQARFNSKADIKTIKAAIAYLNQGIGLEDSITFKMETHPVLNDTTVVGEAQEVMMLIGAIANMGHEGLKSVSTI